MRGQEEAPFEILIGIIIFAFVMSIASYLWASSCENQLRTKLQAELTNFARNIESVYKGGMYTTETVALDFSVVGCGGYMLDKIVLYEGSQKECLSHTGLNKCYVIAARITDPHGGSAPMIREYLSIPTTVTITISGDTCSGDYLTTPCKLAFRKYAAKITKTGKNSLEIEISG